VVRDVENTGESETQVDSTAKGAGSATEPPADLSSTYQRLLAEKQELLERLMRRQAEFENFRKRTQREKEEFLAHANAELIRALLPALDGFERALGHRDPKVPKQYYEGIQLIYSGLMEVLSRAGLEPLETVGRPFDPHYHQAVETVEVAGARDQEIVEELQKGYQLKQRLLRPAIVKVAIPPRDTHPGDGAASTAEASGDQNL